MGCVPRSFIVSSKNCFLRINCPNIAHLLLKDGADVRMKNFFCKHNLLDFLPPCVIGFTFFRIFDLFLISFSLCLFCAPPLSFTVCLSLFLTLSLSSPSFLCYIQSNILSAAIVQWQLPEIILGSSVISLV